MDGVAVNKEGLWTRDMSRQPSPNSFDVRIDFKVESIQLWRVWILFAQLISSPLTQSVSQCSVCLSIQGCAMALWYWGCCGFNGNRNASDIVEQIKFFDEISFTRPHSQPHPHRHLPCNRSTGLSSEGERRRKDGWICVVRFY